MEEPAKHMLDGLYACDPSLNLDCPKWDCASRGGLCRLTSHREYAVIGADGEPVPANLLDDAGMLPKFE